MNMHNAVYGAIVTGASRGIGAAIARRLAKEGLGVVVNYVSSAHMAEALAADITAQGGRAVAVKADVTDAGQAATLFDACEARFGGVRVLVNNAGLMQPGMVPLAQTDGALFERIVSTNIRGGQHAAPCGDPHARRGAHHQPFLQRQPYGAAGVFRLRGHKIGC